MLTSFWGRILYSPPNTYSNKKCTNMLVISYKKWILNWMVFFWHPLSSIQYLIGRIPFIPSPPVISACRAHALRRSQERKHLWRRFFLWEDQWGLKHVLYCLIYIYIYMYIQDTGCTNICVHKCLHNIYVYMLLYIYVCKYIPQPYF